MTPTEPGFNADELRAKARAVLDTKDHPAGSYHTTSALEFASSILALLDEIESLRQVAESDRQTAQDFADEVVAAHVERDIRRARLAAVSAVLNSMAIFADQRAKMNDRPFDDDYNKGIRRVLTELRAVLAEGGASDGPDPDGGIDLTDEEFAAFLKAARG